MNVQQKVSALEALLARVQRNAAAPRPMRPAVAQAAPAANDADLPAELAHAVFSPPPTPKPAEVAVKPAAAAVRAAPDAAPESKPKLVALAPPLASAARSMTPAYGTSAQKQPPVEAKQATPKAPAVAPGPRPATPAAKPAPAAASLKPEPAAARAVAEKPTTTPVAPTAAASAPAPVGRAGSKTLMGTGLTELRAALAEVTQPRKAAEESKLVADESTGEGATLIRESPLKGADDDGEYDSESTRLMPQPTQEELIAASQRFKGAPLDDDSTGEGATLVRESPLVAAAPAPSPTPPAAAARPAAEAPRVEVRTPAARVAVKPVVTAPPEPAFATTTASETDQISPKARREPAVQVGKAGTAIMDVSPIAAAVAPPPMPPPVEPRAASTPPPMPVVASAAAAPLATEPVAPAPPPAVPMPSAPPPSVPSFMQPGGGSVRPAPMPEPLPPAKKRGTASMLGVGLAAAALVAAGGWLALRNGWITNLGPLGSLVGGPPHPTAAPSGSAAPSAAPSAKTTASAARSAAPSAARSAEPAAVASAVPSATPSATPSAAPAAGADASALPARQGYLVVTSAQSGTVFINAKPIGELGTPIAVACGIKFIRLGTANGKAPPQFIGPGRSVNVRCRKTTETTLPGPATAAPAGQAPATTADAPAPAAPDL